MQHLKGAILLTLLAVAPASSQVPDSCRTTIWSDARAVANDLATIRGAVDTEAFRAAVESLAETLEPLLPTLNQPSQAAVEKFLTGLQQATAPEGVGGAAITNTEKIKLANDLAALLLASGATSAQAQQILASIEQVLATLEGVDTSALTLDLKKLSTDLKACRS